jgi:antitoxin component HigA of HigAB toxin-antitoxin module
MSHLLDPHALHTDAEYRAALAELEQVLLCDPGTPAGCRCDELVALIDGYEARRRHADLAADAELRRVWARAWAAFGLPHDVPDAVGSNAADRATARVPEARGIAARLSGGDDGVAGPSRPR